MCSQALTLVPESLLRHHQDNWKNEYQLYHVSVYRISITAKRLEVLINDVFRVKDLAGECLRTVFIHRMIC